MNVYMKLLVRLSLLWCCLLMSFSCQDREEAVEGLPCKLAEKGKWGIVSTDGKNLLVPYVLDNKPSCVVNGMFAVPTQDSLFQLFHVDNPLAPVSPRRFYRIGYFFEEVTIAQETPEGAILLIDKTGRTVFSTEQIQLCQIDLIYNFREGRALFVTQDGKYGYLSTEGQIVIPPLYDCAYSFKEGVALVGQSDGKGRMAYQMIDENGAVCSFLPMVNGLLEEEVGDGLLFCKEVNGHCTYWDKRGTPVLYLPEEIVECTSFVNGLAVFQTKSQAGVIDVKGNMVIPATYDGVSVAGEDRVVLSLGKQYALADAEGVLLSAMQYDSIGRFYHSGMAVVRQGATYGWMNRAGKVETDGWYLIAEDPEARRDLSQFLYRQYVAEEQVTEAEDEAPVKAVKAYPGKHEMNRDAWKEITSRSPFYEEMKRVISGELEEHDAENRRLILNYVEHFRTSYTTKDIDFLEQLFSEDALIVVGTVIKSIPQTELEYLPQSQVLYNVKSKRQYLDRLKDVFATNQKIEVGFDDFKIMRHPTRKDIYGVTLRQHYSSDSYSDDGYLFLLWDFQDRMAPKIHVRTWQPSIQDDQSPLPMNKVFNIRNFNLQ